MSKKLLIALGGLVVIGVMLWFGLRLAAPTQLPGADAETFARANQLYDKGQYAEAANLYEQLLAQGVENPEVYYNAGMAYTALKQPDKAGDAFARAKALAPRDTQIAQAAPPSRMDSPLTQNELLLVLLGVLGCVAVAFVVLRRREAIAVG